MKKYLSIIFLCLFSHLSWAQSGEGYDPQNPGDPNVYYRLMVEASPKKGGSVSPSSIHQISAGATTFCYATPKTGYRFKQWMVGDSVVSTASSFTYTMPEENVTLIAYFDWIGNEGYNPENPGDPFIDGYQHKVTLYATPSAGGRFNSSSFYLSEGKTTNVYAYPSSGYRFVSWKQNGKIVSTKNPMEISMGTEDLEYTAQFVYDPVNPENPGANSFNASTGELIIDDFEAGGLSSAIYTTLSSDENYSKVKSITIIGQMEASDFGFLYRMTSCTIADISRTTGYNNVPNYAFEGAYALKTLILPYSVESIGNYAFSGCSNLTTLYCYATTPPSVSSTTFDGVSSSMKVLVPALSLELYKSANYWKDFVLSALDGVTNTLTISLPEDAKDGRYKNMTLELDNITSGQVSRMLITDRTRYSFVNLIHNTKYNVYVKTAKSVVLGEIQDVEIVDKDVETEFTQLKQPQTVTMSVYNPQGENLTQSTDITWFDESGQYLATGNSISGYVDGTILKYRIKLSNEAALYYVAPQDSTYEIKSANNEFYSILTPLQLVTVTGYVRNANTKNGICDVNVSISQQTSGKQSRTVVAKTDVNGMFKAEVYNSPASISCTAYNYVNKSLDVESFAISEGKVTMDDITMNSIVGATVNISLTYQESVLEDETPEVQDWYDDYQNLVLSVYNLTTEKEINQISNRYPQFVLMDGVKVGDELRITLSSKKDYFEPVVIEKVVDDSEEINANFAIKQFGGLQVSYQTTSNDAVVGILYDKNGYFNQKQDFVDGMIEFSGLRDGTYDLVTMGKNDPFNSIYNILRLNDASLVEGIDYMRNRIIVESGIIKDVNIVNIPFLNLAKFNTINKESSFLAINTSSVVAGNYVTLTGYVELQNDEVIGVEDIKLVIDIPPMASFVNGSVMINDKVINNYTFNDSTLIVPFSATERNCKIKFCIIPIEEGLLQPNAMVSFRANNENLLVPIKSDALNVQAVSLHVPPVISKPEFVVSGVSLGNDEITIYGNDVVIGKTIANASGKWSVKVALDNPLNLSKYFIQAKLSRKDGLEINSEIKLCQYDIDASEISKVEMYHNGKTVIFDFINTNNQPSSYSIVSGRNYTFTIDFTDNNPEKIYDVILYALTRQGDWIPLNAEFSEEKGLWYAKANFINTTVIVNVGVDYKLYKKSRMSADEMSICLQKPIQNHKETKVFVDKIDSLFAALSLAYDSEDKEQIVNIQSDIESLAGVKFSYEGDLPETTDFDEDELLKDIDEVLSDSISWNNLLGDFGKNNNDLAEYLEGCVYQNCDGITTEWLLQQGFESLEKDNGGKYYFHTTDSFYKFVDFDNDIYLTVDLSKETAMANMAKAFGTPNTRGDLNSDDNFFKDLCNNIKSTVNAVVGAIDHIEKYAYTRNEKLTSKLNKVNYSIKVREDAGVIVRRKLLKERDKILKEIIKNDKIASSLEENLKHFHIGEAAGKVFALADIAITAFEAYEDYKKISGLYSEVPDCPNKEGQESAKLLRDEIRNWGIACGAYYIGNFASSLTQLGLMSAGIAGAVPTGGLSLGAVSLALGVAAANVAAAVVYGNQMDTNYDRYSYRIDTFKCDDDDNGDDNDDDNGDDNDGDNGKKKEEKKTKNFRESGNSNAKYSIDPSGYVYEGVFNNRIEGVTATCYQKIQVEDMYGDLHDNIVKWDAEEYSQENPLYTDKDGFYQWFVPEGLWQVKYEKEGYETAYSDWLPVPPPQLDVNIGIVQNRQPEIKEAHAYVDGVEMTFDKYMIPAYLTTDNIKVSQNGKYVDGKIVLVDEEIAYRDENVKYASCVRFIPNTAFSADKEVTLIVNNRVKSYAGIQMAETYTQSFDIEKEVKSIVADSLVKVPYQGSKVVTLYVLPADAAVGKTMHAESSSEMLASLVQKDVTIDENGMAQFEIIGELPGTTSITFSINGVKTTATMIANVDDFETYIVNVPKASLISGSSVYRGTSVELMADSKDLKIWYTIDGTCPCDENGSRKQYTEPIVINSDMTLKAIAENADGDASDVATFIYSILQSKAGVSLADGWNWVSFNMKNDALSSVNSAMTSGSWTSDDVIKDNKYVDMYSLNQKQWIGTLSKQGALNNTQMYKVRSSKSQTLSLAGEAVHPGETNITVGSGWNYISYLPLTSMSVNDALKNYRAENGDVIKSQDAFATYSTTNGWEGDLTTLTLGRGYMLKRSANASQTTFTYPVESSETSVKAPATAKSYRYADNMNIIGEVKGICVEEDDSLVAYVNGEVRGACRLERKQKVFLTVQGDENAKMAIVLVRDGEIVATASNIIDYQSNRVWGTSDAPAAITFITDDMSIDGGIENIKAIYSISGIKMGTRRLNNIPTGTYIIYYEKDGNTCVTKFIK